MSGASCWSPDLLLSFQGLSAVFQGQLLTTARHTRVAQLDFASILQRNVCGPYRVIQCMGEGIIIALQSRSSEHAP